MSTAPLESRIVEAITAWINAQPGCRAVKNHGSVYGSPTVDITACIWGRMAQVEVKRPGQRATDRQLQTLSVWASAGALTGVVHSVAEARELLGLLERGAI